MNDQASKIASGQDAEQIGARIRRLRKDRGWTLGQLSAASTVSVATLSKIENAVSVPYFDTILKISKAFGVSFESLLNDPASPQGARFTSTKAGQGTHFSTSMYEYEVHAPDLRSKRMIPLHMRVRARDLLDIANWSSHEGEEFIYVIQGEVELHTEHYAPHRLKAGDSAYIDSRMRHAFVNVGDGDAEMLSICLNDGSDLFAHTKIS